MKGIESNKKKLPSQTEINPRENASVITFRSGKEVQTFLSDSITIANSKQLRTMIDNNKKGKKNKYY